MVTRNDPYLSDERRRVLQTLGTVGLIGAAGCADLLDDGDDGNENGDDENGDAETAVAVFEVTNLVPTDGTAVQGDDVEITAGIENTGDVEGTQEVELRVGDDSVATRSVTVDAGESETVTFEAVETGALEPDRYTVGVYTDDGDLTTTLSVLWNIPEEERPPSVIPGEGPLTGDPPSDATSLWNGEDATLDGWKGAGGGDAGWEETDEYFRVVPGAGDIVTGEDLGDVHLHLEWSAPDHGEGEGQDRGNSGLKFMTLYEIQVLDNYENSTYEWGWAGSYYGQAAPLASPLRPPDEWQTYDIVWRGPRFENDEVVRPAQTTVFLNGVVVQAHLDAEGISGGEIDPYEPHPPEMPLLLQDHTDEVAYRNVWYRELPEKPVEIDSPDDLPHYDTSSGPDGVEPEHVDPGGVGTAGEPPADAATLIDGDLDGWRSVAGGDPGWSVHDDYVEVEPGAGDIETDRGIGDCQVHLEWRVPEDADGAGLHRGDSGILLLGQYGFQILDNFENPTPPETWVGSYVDQAAPHASPIREPGEWQQFDVVWQGPRFEDGERTHPAQATVFLNGVAVQTRLVLDGPNAEDELREYEPHDREAPLRLQDGGSRVQFRNVWYRDLA